MQRGLLAPGLGSAHPSITPAAHLERLGGVDALPQMYARLLDVVAQRPATFTITTVEGWSSRRTGRSLVTLTALQAKSRLLISEGSACGAIQSRAPAPITLTPEGVVGTARAVLPDPSLGS